MAPENVPSKSLERFHNKFSYFRNGIFDKGLLKGSRARLGVNFLRSAYLMHNINNVELSIAQAIFDSTTSNIIELCTGYKGVASLISSNSTKITTMTSKPMSTVFSSSSLASVSGIFPPPKRQGATNLPLVSVLCLHSSHSQC